MTARGGRGTFRWCEMAHDFRLFQMRRGSRKGNDMAWRLWPLLVLGVTVAWIAIAIAVNHGPSGMALGAAAGSTTLRDPLFLISELIIGIFVRRWWQLLAAAVAVSAVYTLSFNGAPLTLNDGSIRWWPFVGRALSIIVVCSALALVLDLCRRTLKSIGSRHT
jgi:hypothetical protein